MVKYNVPVVFVSQYQLLIYYGFTINFLEGCCLDCPDADAQLGETEETDLDTLELNPSSTAKCLLMEGPNTPAMSACDTGLITKSLLENMAAS